jgi:hypothetical protein
LRRTLYLHAGGAKTGTSAIQNALERNADVLAAAGIAYAHRLGFADDRAITSGNGVRLQQLVLAGEPRIRIAEALLSYLQGADAGICSSEAFHLLSTDQWSQLVDAADAANVRIHVIFYVRNVEPCLASQYDQLIKRHGEFRSFATYLLYAEWDHYLALLALHGVRHRISLSVLHYDREHDQLLKSFLDVLRPGMELHASLPPLQLVNRALTESERTILRQVNLLANDRFSEEISDALLRAHPEAPRSRAAGQDIKLLDRRFAAQVAWVNREYFPAGPAVSLTALPPNDRPAAKPERVWRAPGLRAATRAVRQLFRAARAGCSAFRQVWRHEADPQDQAAETCRLFVHWAVSRLEQQDRDRILKRLRHWAGQRQAGQSAANSIDLDPVVYLLLNEDVLFSDVDPIEHYARFGAKEQRRIRFK